MAKKGERRWLTKAPERAVKIPTVSAAAGVFLFGTLDQRLSLRGVAPAAVLAEEAVLDLRINFVKPLLCAIGPLLIHADLSL